MAHLEKLFKPEGLPDNPYQSLDSRVVYKSETATAEMKEVRPLKKDFHPITTEIHVTELRPIKLESLKQNQPLPKTKGNTWERRLLSEGNIIENGHHEAFRESHTESRRSHSTASHSTATTRHMEQREVDVNDPQLTSTMVRTVTSRHGSYGQSPRSPISPSEFKRRDVSPDHKLTDQSVTMVDGKCNCCPYGYHVDVDFMGYCDTLSNQSYLKQLKRIQREKRKLRKSMEVYVQDQELMEGRSTMVNPMETKTYYQERTTNRLLDDIDTSVDQTLTSIETLMRNSKEQQVYNDSGTATMREAPKKFNTFPKKVGKQVAEELQNYNETFTATYNDTKRHDSNSSLSSISTVELERVYPHTGGYTSTETTTTRTSNMTSQQLAETMAVHLPQEDGAASAQSNMTNISKQSLQAIREAMAVSLQRMKELEDQVKAIPVLQVRISVLKEEKRLLGLQMQAQKHVNTVSRGAGSDSPPPSPMSPPPTLPKPKVRMAAVGDHDVNEPYLLQPEMESTHVYEKETLIIDRAQQQSALFAEMSKPLTRTVGVGEGNVFDDSLHIHEKELRTVIIGQGERTMKRNVGIECRPSTRDVGVLYNFDTVEKPSTRSVGITTETTALVTNVSFRSEEFTSALRNALAKNVRSVAVQANNKLESRHVGIQSSVSSWNIRTIGVGDCSIDVEVRNPVAKRSVGVDAFPDRMNRAVNTDYGWRLDAFTNTVPQFTGSESTQTEDVRKYHTSTMTERSQNYTTSCQTDVKVFTALDVLKNSGSNTDKVLTYNTGMNTVLRPVMERGVNTIHQKNSRSYGVNTVGPDVRNMGVGEGIIEDSEEEYRFEEEGVETKTVYYATTEDKAKKEADKGYEIKREYAGATESSESSMSSSSKIQRLESSDKSDDDTDQNEEVVEEKVWRTSGDGQFTVTTVTTRRTYGADGKGDVQTETKTVTGGPEVLGSAAEMIQKEVASGRRSSSIVMSTGTSSESSSIESSPTRQKNVTNVSNESMDSGSSSSASALERVLGADYAEKIQRERELMESDDGSSMVVSRFSTSSGSLGGSSVRGLSDGSSSMVVSKFSTSSGGTSGGDLSLKSEFDDSGLSSSQSSSSSERVTKHTRIVRDSASSPTVVVSETFSSFDDSPTNSTQESMTSSSSSWVSESQSPSGTLKSIMKKNTADGGSQKRGITFAESVVGGFELDPAMKDACQTLATYLEDSTQVQTKQLNASLEVIQKEWFKVSSSKLADAHQNEDYLSCFNEISKRLLEHIVNLQDSNGNTAVHYAVSNCNFDIVSLLLDTGVCNLNKMNKAGYTAVIMATLASVQTQRQEEVVQRLFSMGNVNIKAAKDGQTALMFAVRQGRNDMVKMLLDTGADTNIQDDEGSTALMCAAEHGHTEIVKMLLNSPGCDASLSDNDGSTALSIAMDAGHKDAGVLLYAHVNFGNGQSPAPGRKPRKTSGSSPLASPAT